MKRKRLLRKESRKAFGISLRGYKRNNVDNMIEEMRDEIQHLTSYNEQATSEISKLKAEVLDLKIQVKTGGPNGYIALRTLFEQTLGRAEEQAEKMLADAGEYALRIREESNNEADSIARVARAKADRVMQEAEAKAEETRRENADRQAEIHNAALASIREANDRIQAAQKEAANIKSDVEKYAAELRSQVHLEKRAVRESRL